MLPLLGTMSVRIGRAHGLGWKELPWKALADDGRSAASWRAPP